LALGADFQVEVAERGLRSSGAVFVETACAALGEATVIAADAAIDFRAVRDEIECALEEVGASSVLEAGIVLETVFIEDAGLTVVERAAERLPEGFVAVLVGAAVAVQEKFPVTAESVVTMRTIWSGLALIGDADVARTTIGVGEALAVGRGAAVSIQTAWIVARAFLGEAAFAIVEELDPIAKVTADAVADPGSAFELVAEGASESIAPRRPARIGLVTIGVFETEPALVVCAEGFAIEAIRWGAALAMGDMGAVAAEPL
jgi:hypothetical protein